MRLSFVQEEKMVFIPITNLLPAGILRSAEFFWPGI